MRVRVARCCQVSLRGSSCWLRFIIFLCGFWSPGESVFANPIEDAVVQVTVVIRALHLLVLRTGCSLAVAKQLRSGGSFA